MHPIEYSEVKTGVIGAIIVWNIVTNCLLIAVLLKYTELREDRTALFVISLSLADLGIGLCLPTSAALCHLVRATHDTTPSKGKHHFDLVFWLYLATQPGLGGLVQDGIGTEASKVRTVDLKKSLLRNHCLYLDRQRRPSCIETCTCDYMEYELLYVQNRSKQHKCFSVVAFLVRSLVNCSANGSPVRHSANFPRRRPSSQSGLGSSAVDQRRRRRIRNGDSEGDSFGQKRPCHLLRRSGSFGAGFYAYGYTSHLVRSTSFSRV